MQPIPNDALSAEGRSICSKLSHALFESESVRGEETTGTTEREIKAKIESKGFTFIAEGIGRSVYEPPERLCTTEDAVVVKLSRPILSSDPVTRIDAQNGPEIAIWRYAGLERLDPLRPTDLAPIRETAQDQSWLVMERRDTVDNHEAVEYLRKRVGESPVFNSIEDSALGQRDDGHVQIIDYGNPLPRR